MKAKLAQAQSKKTAINLQDAARIVYGGGRDPAYSLPYDMELLVREQKRRNPNEVK